LSFGFAGGRFESSLDRSRRSTRGSLASGDWRGCVQRVRILGGSYFFRPRHIIVKANALVELSVSLEPGIVPHTLVIQAAEAGISIDASLGTDPKTFAFTPKAVGKYPFYCKNKLLLFKSHREKGMEGILEVVE
jgi:hypothetical protein